MGRVQGSTGEGGLGLHGEPEVPGDNRKDIQSRCLPGNICDSPGFRGDIKRDAFVHDLADQTRQSNSLL